MKKRKEIIMEKNKHVIEIKIEGKEWNDCLDKAFKKKNKEIKIDGFRKGSAPKDLYIKKFGIESLYMDAVDTAVEPAYKKMLEDNKLIPVIEPSLDVKSINENEVVFEFTILTAPEIKLGEYTNLKVKKEKVSVSKEEIQEEIKQLSTKYAEIVVKEEGEVESGDTAVIDFKGYVDGVELEGGNGENYPLEIGSNTFIPGFESGLIGATIGKELTLDLTFPDNYTKELANKDVKFEVVVREIKTRQLPEMNEDFFADLGFENVKTEAELNKEIEKTIIERKEAEVEDKYIEACLAKAAENMEFTINKELLDDEVHRMIHQFEEQLKMQGLNMEQYEQFTGIDHHKLHEQMEPEAEKRIKYRYLLEAIANKENIEINDKDAEVKAEEMAKNYGISKEELLEAYGSLDIVKYDMKMHQAMEIIKAGK